MQCGVIGLGTIGGGIARSLVRRGRRLYVYDIKRDAADRLDGVPPALGSPAEVAERSDLVFVSVVDAGQVRDAVLGPEGLLQGARRDLVVLIAATIPVSDVMDLARSCGPQGVTVIDCGVNLGSLASENGLLLFVGGPEVVIHRIAPVLDDVASRILHCGPLGAGMATKLGCQVVTAGRWRAMREAVELTTASGVDPRTFIAAVEASDPDGTSLARLERLRLDHRSLDEFSRPVRHYARNLDKDLQAVQALASETGVVVPLVDLARACASDTFGWADHLEDG